MIGILSKLKGLNPFASPLFWAVSAAIAMGAGWMKCAIDAGVAAGECQVALSNLATEYSGEAITAEIEALSNRVTQLQTRAESLKDQRSAAETRRDAAEANLSALKKERQNDPEILECVFVFSGNS